MARLIFLILFFLISLLSVCKAPAYYLWLLAIAVTEYPLIFAAIAAVLLAWGNWVTSYKVIGNWIGVVSLILFLSPIARAYIIGIDLQKNMAAAFTGGGHPPIFPAKAPFSFGQLLKSAHGDGYNTYTYVEQFGYKLTLDYYATSPKSSPNERTSEGKDSLSFGEGRGEVKRPCVIIVHGGSWSGGDSQQLPELNSYLASKGYNVASINYRMAPKYQTPAPVQDVKEALEYLTMNADRLHIDTNNFVLMGRSAGAQISMLAAYTLHDKRIKGAINYYGPVDMVWAYSVPSNPLIMDSRKVMDAYVGGSYSQVPAKYAACSPVEYVDDNTVPTLTIHGDNDVLVSPIHAQHLELKLTQHNIRHYYLKLPWATHAFDFNLNGPSGQLSTYAVETFLNTVTQ